MNGLREIVLTLGVVSDGSLFQRDIQRTLQAVLGDHFFCRTTEPSDLSVDVLVVVGERLLVQAIKEALLAGFPPARIVVVIGEPHRLDGVCLDDLGIHWVVGDSPGRIAATVVAKIRLALGQLTAQRLPRSRIDETLGQLDMLHAETLRGLAFKRRLASLHFSPAENCGLHVTVIPGRDRSYPSFGSCQDGGKDLCIVHATESGVEGLNASEHALFTQALLSHCILDQGIKTSFVSKFVEGACSILGRDEVYRPALLIFHRSLQTLDILLTGNLDLWIVNPQRLPSVGVTHGPGVALSGAKNSPSGKQRRIRISTGDRFLLLPSGWFQARDEDPKSCDNSLLEAVVHDNLQRFLSLHAPGAADAALVVAIEKAKEVGRLSR